MDCILSGVGGQGTVLASKLIAGIALLNGQKVRTAETIGMAQRGGCVVSHVRTGSNIDSPLVPLGQADLIIGFEPAEAVRCLPYLKQGGAVVACRKAVRPVTASLLGSDYDGSEMIEYLQRNVKNLVLVDGQAICEQAGSAKVLNIALLGAAVGAEYLDITAQQLEQALQQAVPQKFLAMNIDALYAGMAAAGNEEHK